MHPFPLTNTLHSLDDACLPACLPTRCLEQSLRVLPGSYHLLNLPPLAHCEAAVLGVAGPSMCHVSAAVLLCTDQELIMAIGGGGLLLQGGWGGQGLGGGSLLPCCSARSSALP